MLLLLLKYGISEKPVGRRDLRRHFGTCAFCRQPVWLSDYDGRVWLAVLGVPIFPMGRARILNHCMRCGRFRAVALCQWRQLGPAAAAEVLEPSVDPASAQAAIEQLAHLVALHRQAEAVPLATEFAQRFADNAMVQLRAGDVFAACGRTEQALAAYVRALELNPNNPQARQGAGLMAIRKGDLERAKELLGYGDRLGRGFSRPAFGMLVEAYRQRQRHDEAVEILRRMLVAAPGLVSDKDFRRRIRACERAAGTDRSMLARWRRRRLLTVGLVVAGALAVTGGVALLAVWQPDPFARRLYVVNGLPVPVRVDITGQAPMTIAPNEPVRLFLSTGWHPATLIGPDGLREHVDIAILADPFKDSSEKGVHILNVFGAAAIVREHEFYSPGAAPPAKDEAPQPWEVHVGSDLLILRSADYVFEEFPPKVRLAEGDDGWRSGLFVSTDSPSDTVYGLAVTGLAPTAKLMRFAESHLWARPDDKELLRVYHMLAVARSQEARCEMFLAKGLEYRPVRVEWHRLHQDIHDTPGEAEAQVQRYRRMASREPGNSALVYLAGRLESRGSKYAAQMDRALALDRRNHHAWRDKSFCLLGRGRFREARDAAWMAQHLAPNDREAKARLTEARFALRRLATLEKESRKELAEDPADLDWQQVLMETLVAKGDWAAAFGAHDAYVEAVRKRREKYAEQLALQAKLLLMELEGNFLGVLGHCGQLKDANSANVQRFQACLELNRVADAVKFSARLPERTWEQDLLLAIASHCDGDAEAAARWRAAARDDLARQGSHTRVVAQLLRHGRDADRDVAEDLLLLPWTKAIVLVALVQAGADRGMLDLAERLNYYPRFPRRLLQRAIEQLKARRPSAAAPARSSRLRRSPGSPPSTGALARAGSP